MRAIVGHGILAGKTCDPATPVRLRERPVARRTPDLTSNPTLREAELTRTPATPWNDHQGTKAPRKDRSRPA